MPSRPPVLALTSLPYRVIAPGSGRLGRKSCWFVLCVCVHLPVLGINGQGFWASCSIWLHSALRTSGSSPTSMAFPPLRTFTFFFPGPLHLSGTTPSFWEPFFKASALLSGCKPHGFPNLNSACAEA